MKIFYKYKIGGIILVAQSKTNSKNLADKNSTCQVGGVFLCQEAPTVPAVKNVEKRCNPLVYFEGKQNKFDNFQKLLKTEMGLDGK